MNATSPSQPGPCLDRALVACAEAAVACLQAYALTVVTAESCTAGLLSALLAQVEGAGELLHGGFVVYTKEQKERALGVERAVLDREGSVNATVAAQLACGALDRSNADVALAITGVLGPMPDEDGNPVGLVFIACCRRGQEPRVLRRDYGQKPHDTLLRTAIEDALTVLEHCASPNI